MEIHTQKQPLADVLQNRCSYKFHKTERKTPVLKPKLCNFIKESLQHSCSSMNIAKFLRTPFLQSSSIQVLLQRRNKEQKINKPDRHLTARCISWTFLQFLVLANIQIYIHCSCFRKTRNTPLRKLKETNFFLNFETQKLWHLIHGLF